MQTNISATRRRRNTWRSSTLGAGASTKDPGWVSTAPASIPGHSTTGQFNKFHYSTVEYCSRAHASILDTSTFSYLYLIDHLAGLMVAYIVPTYLPYPPPSSPEDDATQLLVVWLSSDHEHYHLIIIWERVCRRLTDIAPDLRGRD